MNIIRNTHKVNASRFPVPDNNYLSGRIGFWGLVSAQNSLNNTVTVISDTGFEYKNIPVFSSEWVTVDDDKNYIPSTRNLPPVKSRVFVLTPTFTAVGAFVLCSGFSKGDENIRTLWAANESELEDKNNCRETKTQGGWDIQEEYANGNFSAESNDQKIKIVINTTKDDNKSQPKEVSLKAWDNTIKIDDVGIDIKDKYNNEIKRDSDGITITDTNGNVIKMTNTDIQVIASTDEHGAKTVKIGNSIDTIKGLFDDLVTVLNNFQTAGSPANHTAVPGQFEIFSQKLAQVLE